MTTLVTTDDNCIIQAYQRNQFFLWISLSRIIVNVHILSWQRLRQRPATAGSFFPKPRTKGSKVRFDMSEERGKLELRPPVLVVGCCCFIKCINPIVIDFLGRDVKVRFLGRQKEVWTVLKVLVLTIGPIYHQETTLANELVYNLAVIPAPEDMRPIVPSASVRRWNLSVKGHYVH